MLNMNLHHINYCFNIALPLFTHTNLVYLQHKYCHFLFLNVAPSQNLVFIPSASIRINTVFGNRSLFSQDFENRDRGILHSLPSEDDKWVTQHKATTGRHCPTNWPFFEH